MTTFALTINMVTACSNGRGRIFPHQRNANLTGTILGDTIELDDHYAEDVEVIERHSIEVSTKKEHRNRIRQIYRGWEANFPEYYAVGVKVLTTEELNDRGFFPLEE